MATSLKTSIRTSAMTDIINSIGATSRIKFYTGSIPLPTAAPSGSILCTLTPSATFGVSSAGVLTANAIASDTSCAGSGTPSYYRIIDGTVDDGTHTQVQGTSGVGSGDINWSSLISAGGTAAISSLSYTEGNP